MAAGSDEEPVLGGRTPTSWGKPNFENGDVVDLMIETKSESDAPVTIPAASNGGLTPVPTPAYRTAPTPPSETRRPTPAPQRVFTRSPASDASPTPSVSQAAQIGGLVLVGVCALALIALGYCCRMRFFFMRNDARRQPEGTLPVVDVDDRGDRQRSTQKTPSPVDPMNSQSLAVTTDQDDTDKNTGSLVVEAFAGPVRPEADPPTDDDVDIWGSGNGPGSGERIGGGGGSRGARGRAVRGDVQLGEKHDMTLARDSKYDGIGGTVVTFADGDVEQAFASSVQDVGRMNATGASKAGHGGGDGGAGLRRLEQGDAVDVSAESAPSNVEAFTATMSTEERHAFCGDGVPSAASIAGKPNDAFKDVRASSSSITAPMSTEERGAFCGAVVSVPDLVPGELKPPSDETRVSSSTFTANMSTEEIDAYCGGGVVGTAFASEESKPFVADEPAPVPDKAPTSPSTVRRKASICTGIGIATAVAESAHELARSSQIPGVSETAAAVSILVNLLTDNQDNKKSAEASLRRCRSIVTMLQRAAKVLDKVRHVLR